MFEGILAGLKQTSPEAFGNYIWQIALDEIDMFIRFPGGEEIALQVGTEHFAATDGELTATYWEATANQPVLTPSGGV